MLTPHKPLGYHIPEKVLIVYSHHYISLSVSTICLMVLTIVFSNLSGDMRSAVPQVANNCTSSTESTPVAQAVSEKNEQATHGPPLRGGHNVMICLERLCLVLITFMIEIFFLYFVFF